MKDSLKNLDSATIRKIMQMDGGGDVTEDEIEAYRRNMDYSTVQNLLNNVDIKSKVKKEGKERRRSSNSNTPNKTNTPVANPNTQQSQSTPSNMNDMMKMAMQMRNEKGQLDFSKMMNNPDIMKMMGNMSGMPGMANMPKNQMMGSISTIIWIFSWIQKIFSFIFSIKGFALMISLYYYFYYYKAAVKLPSASVPNSVDNDDIYHEHNKVSQDEDI